MTVTMLTRTRPAIAAVDVVMTMNTVMMMTMTTTTTTTTTMMILTALTSNSMGGLEAPWVLFLQCFPLQCSLLHTRLHSLGLGQDEQCQIVPFRGGGRARASLGARERVFAEAFYLWPFCDAPDAHWSVYPNDHSIHQAHALFQPPEMPFKLRSIWMAVSLPRV